VVTARGPALASRYVSRRRRHEALADYPVVWAGAGDETAMFPTSYDELLKLTGGTANPVD
jgi:hypothetical protein